MQFAFKGIELLLLVVTMGLITLTPSRPSTTKRHYFSMVCLIAIGGYNANYIDVVEYLDGEAANE